MENLNSDFWEEKLKFGKTILFKMKITEEQFKEFDKGLEQKINKMTQYKHKITGKIVTIQELGCQAIKGAKWGDWEIPFWVIENSNDWELVVDKKSLFTTLDGVEVFKEDVYWYIPQTIDEIYKCTRADVDFTPYLSFSTEIAAKNYKAENEKRFSLLDIIEVLKFYTDKAPASYIKTQIVKDIWKLKSVN
jgi:hypothetical protein